MKARRAIVTGASDGIGLAISERLAEDGWEVVGVARRFGARPVAPFARTVSCDLSRIDGLESLARTLAAEESAAEAVVQCAGIGRFAPLESLSVDHIRQVVDLDLVAPMIVARAFVPGFKTRRRGDLVFIGSEASHAAGPRGTAYCAAKFGLRGFVQSLRIECAARGVRVSLVNPGMTDTGFYKGQGFAPGADEAQHLRATDTADAVSMVLSAPPGTVFDEINLSPLNRVIDFSQGKRD